MTKHSMGAIVALALAAPLAAQQDSTRPMGHGHQHCMGASCPAQGAGGMGMGMGMGITGPMARTMAFTPGHLLDHKDILGLSEAQVTRLTELRDATQRAHAARHELAQRQMRDVARFAESGDTAALRVAFGAHHEAMGGAHWAMLKAAVEARAVLTDAQRTLVAGWGDDMGRHHAGGHHDGHRPGH